METHRIAIIGISASGKSVFGRKLAEKTGLPLIHMDQIFWKGNWEAVPQSEYLKRHQEIIQENQWIIEGYVNESMADRLKRADQIIYLDYPGWLCTLRLIWRWLMHRKQARPELPKEALENLKYETFLKVLNRKERIRIEKSLELAGNQNVVRIKGPGEIKHFFK